MAAGAASDVGAANRDLAERVLTGDSPKERQILLLREVMGYTAAESAKVLGCSELAARIRAPPGTAHHAAGGGAIAGRDGFFGVRDAA